MGNGVLGVMRSGPWEEGAREEGRERESPASARAEKNKLVVGGSFLSGPTSRVGSNRHKKAERRWPEADMPAGARGEAVLRGNSAREQRRQRPRG